MLRLLLSPSSTYRLGLRLSINGTLKRPFASKVRPPRPTTYTPSAPKPSKDVTKLNASEVNASPHPPPEPTIVSPFRYYTDRALRITPLLLPTFLFLHIFTTHFYSIAPTYGISMYPTMAPVGEVQVISKYHRRGRDIQVGDIINCHHPQKMLEGVIKRVIGMPRDFVVVDSEPQVYETIEEQETERVYREAEKRMIQVPEGHCWLEGDNRPWSRDSRIYGPVPLALIKGKVVARVWPWRKRAWFRNSFED